MKLSEIVARAHLCIGNGCVYRLGKGGMRPLAEWPWTAEKECDCSGFSSWCVGMSRFHDGLWYDTSRIVRDATAAGGLFSLVPWKDALPGHLVVYGDRGKSQGHVGVVSVVDEAGPLTVIHCSAGLFRRNRDAIGETGIALFRAAGAIVVRCHSVDEG